MSYKIVKAVQTCWGFPSQWDAWTDTGQYLYLRYRYGCGTVEEFDDPDPETWSLKPPNITFETSDEVDGGVITLVEFAKEAEDGISQAEFCRQVGVSPKHLNQVIQGKATASPIQLEMWAFALGRRWSVDLVQLSGVGRCGRRGARW